MITINLKGQYALIGGSSDGIGMATAMVLAEAGATVTLLARNEAKLQQVLSHLPKPYEQAHDYVIGDFFQPSVVKDNVLEHIKKTKKKFQILVNNTGGPSRGPLLHKNEEDITKYMNQHLVCFHMLTQAVMPSMKEGKYGRIVNITSNAAKQPLPNMGLSNTVRGAVSNWAKTLANELGVHGITVNNILPGATETKELRDVLEKKAEQSGKDIKLIEENLCNQIPLRRLADSKEIAQVVAFVASPLASYINGINLVVDGGKTGSL